MAEWMVDVEEKVINRYRVTADDEESASIEASGFRRTLTESIPVDEVGQVLGVAGPIDVEVDDSVPWMLCKCGKKFEGADCGPELQQHVEDMYALDDPLHYGLSVGGPRPWQPEKNPKQGVKR